MSLGDRAPATSSELRPPDGFRALLPAGEIGPGQMRSVEAGGRRVLVLDTSGAFYAVEDRCTHADTPLSSGRLRACILECPLHGGRFDVRDGRPVAGPPRRPLATFVTRVKDGWIEVRIG